MPAPQARVVSSTIEMLSTTRELDVAVSADGRYVPLRLDGSLDGFPISAVLAGDCAGPAGCAAAE